MVSIGTKIRLLRTLLEMKQIEFADLVNVAQSDLSQIESGRLTPTDAIVSKIETALGISLNDSRLEQFLTLKPSLAGLETPDPEPCAV